MSDEKETTNLLASAHGRFGMTPTELGHALVKEAQQREKKTIIDKATGEIQQLYKIIENSKEMVAWHTHLVNLSQNRIAAIEAGAFKLSDDGRVRYEDAELEQAFRGYSLQRVT